MQHLCGEPFSGPIPAGSLEYQVGRGCGDVCISARYSEEAVKLEKIGQPAGGCSIGYGGEEDPFALSRETRL